METEVTRTRLKEVPRQQFDKRFWQVHGKTYQRFRVASRHKAVEHRAEFGCMHYQTNCDIRDIYVSGRDPLHAVRP